MIFGGFDSAREDDDVDFSFYELTEEGVFGTDDEAIGFKGATDFGDPTADKGDAVFSGGGFIELFIAFPEGPHVNVEDGDIDVGVFLADLSGLFQGGHTADAGTVGIVPFVP